MPTIGGMSEHAEHGAPGIGETMAFAAPDPPARVIAARSVTFRGFHALIVDHARLAKSRAAMPSVSSMMPSMPLSHSRWKSCRTVVNGGNSSGNTSPTDSLPRESVRSSVYG